MKFSVLLPLAVSATAFVIPDDALMQQVAITQQESESSIFDQIPVEIPSKDEIKDRFLDLFESVTESATNALDNALEWAESATGSFHDEFQREYFDSKAWMRTQLESVGRPPHHGPPHDGPEHDHPPHPPHDGPDHDKPHHPPHDGPDHDRPHHPPHHKKPHHKSNLTVYELINESKYTTKLAKLINGNADLVKLLNSTDTNFTVFAPTDSAFEKIPDHAKKPSDEIIAKILSYHVSYDFYPAGRILVSKTVPTLLEGKYLSSDPKDTPQRISTNIGLRGLTLNFYSRVVAANIFGSNGVIHGIDSLLIPPPNAARIITLLPSEFSTLELGLHKTGLFDAINGTNHLGGTLFAPSNWAFTKLGPKINAFLFSEYGRKYLTALLEYHVVANQTLYSDAYYSGGDSKAEGTDRHRIPRGKFHVDLPTLLKDRYLSIDIGRFGRLIDVRINGFSHVKVADGIAKDGVVHGLGDVLIPPKKLGGSLIEYQGEDLTVEDLKERLEEYIQQNKYDL